VRRRRGGARRARGRRDGARRVAREEAVRAAGRRFGATRLVVPRVFGFAFVVAVWDRGARRALERRFPAGVAARVRLIRD